MRIAIPSVLSVLTSVALLGCPRHPGPAREAAASAVLAQRYETVFRAPAKLVATGEYESLSQQDAAGLRLPFAVLLGGLESLREGLAADVIGAGDSVLVGAREFRSPEGPPPHLGAVQSRFCFVVLGARELRAERAVGDVGGQELWTWQLDLQEGQLSPAVLYAVRVEADELVVSNDLDDLLAVASALRSRERPTAGGLTPELVRGNAVWGFRRAAHGSAADSATSAIRLPPPAESLLFLVDTRASHAVLRVHVDPSAQAGPELGHPLPPLKKAAGGTWEAAFPLTADPETTFTVVGLLGFGVYL